MNLKFYPANRFLLDADEVYHLPTDNGENYYAPLCGLGDRYVFSIHAAQLPNVVERICEECKEREEDSQ